MYYFFGISSNFVELAGYPKNEKQRFSQKVLCRFPKRRFRRDENRRRIVFDTTTNNQHP